MEDVNSSLDRLFMPRNVAIVGASPKDGPRVQGNNYIRGSINQGFKGKIYPVHPSGENILGFQSYKSVRDIPGEVDLVIFSVPVRAVIQVMEDCVAKGVKFVHLYTAGFSETGIEEYVEIEKRMLEIAQKGGVRILGPNCMGIHCPEGGLSFQPFLPPNPGPVGFFSQSGQLAGFFLMLVGAHKLGISKAASFGNAIDLKAHDFLSYLGDDPKTEIIGSYLEGLKNGRAFFEAAKKITRRKPLIIYKGGQTEGGARATRSHTAAIAGSNEIWQAMCRQSGIISVESLSEMACTMAAFQRMPLPGGNRIAIVGGAGGASVTMTDLAEKEGLSVPHLSPKTVEKLSEFIPPAGSSVMNPLDVGFEAFHPDAFSTLISALRDDPNIDALFFMQPIGIFYHFMGRIGVQMISDITLQIRDQLKKPLYPVVEKDDSFGGLEHIREVEERYHEGGLPTFPSFEIAAKSLKNLWEYQLYLTSIGEKGL